MNGMIYKTTIEMMRINQWQDPRVKGDLFVLSDQQWKAKASSPYSGEDVTRKG